ncbi:MAG: hypothetical protein QXK93_08940, partial [Candidatus Bathyarchaeia archaeon]
QWSRLQPQGVKLKSFCREAVQYGFRCVIVNPVYVRLAASRLRGHRCQGWLHSGFSIWGFFVRH